MGAATADRNAQMKSGGRLISIGVLTGTTIYKGTIVCVTAAGWAVPGADTAGLKVVGIAEEQVTNAGSSGDEVVQVSKGVAALNGGSTPPLQADIGRVVYVSTDQEVEKAGAVSNDVEAGILDSIVGSQYWVSVLDQVEITTAVIPDGSITAAKLATDAVTNVKVDNLAIDTAELAAGAVETAKIEDLNVTTAKIAADAVTVPKIGTNVLYADDLGAPDVADPNYFLISVVMQATAYTLDQTALAADNPPRNVTVAHTTDTTTDTLGNVVIVGTDVNDASITETMAVSADGTATGSKAFKTIVSITTAGWVQAGGVSDLIVAGFGTLCGLSAVHTTADEVGWPATLAGLARTPDSVAVSATLVEENTISLSGGTYDSSKELRVVMRKA